MSWLPSILCLLVQSGADATTQGRFEAYERSVAMVRGELANEPKSADLALVLARLHSESARFADALKAYTEGRQAHPEDPRFLTGLGETYLAQNELDLAVDHLERALAAIGAGARARGVRLPLSEAYTRTGEFGRAVEQLRSAAREGPPSPEILLRLGQALATEARRLRSKGETEKARALTVEARQTLEESLRLQPRSPDGHYALGRLLARTGERELAKKHLEDFRRLRRVKGGVEPKQLAFANLALEAGTAVDLARALGSLGKTDRALSYTTRALALLPRFEPAMVVRGTLLLRARRLQEAERVWEEVLALYAQHATALMGLAEIHIARKDHRRASEYLLRAARTGRSAEAWEVLYELASGGLALPERVEEFARAALRARPTAENYSNLAVTLFERGKRTESERVLKAGLARYPGNEDLVTGLQVLRSAGKGAR